MGIATQDEKKLRSLSFVGGNSFRRLKNRKDQKDGSGLEGVLGW